MSENFLIAIDFGTAYSGCAYSVTQGNEEIKPHLRRWGHECGQNTPKTPTCILFDDRQNFVAFGYEAMNTYLDMGREAKEKYFFKDFKMELYGKKITKNLMISDVNQKKMSAHKVFSESLRFLKEMAVESVNKHAGSVEFSASDFTWVLTVPAIWDAPAKQFMREAAEQAGIVSEKLVIALEPECASVWCRKLSPDKFLSEDSSTLSLSQSPGTRYLVVDCGGGTIDITLHEILRDGNLKELHRASGNNKGGEHVDRRLKECLREYFCGGQWDKYEREHPSKAQKILSDFAIQKQFAKRPKPLNLSCDSKLDRIIEENPKVKQMNGLKWDDGKIVISQDKLLWLFQDSLEHIEKSINEILAKQRKIDFILLVGGFAQCEILCEMIKTQFGAKAQVLCPQYPQEVILKGALVFGRDQSVIRSRKSGYTYGVKTHQDFDFSEHKPEKKITTDAGDMCEDIFHKLVGVDEDVEWNETREFKFSPVYKNQTAANFPFYRTKRAEVTYTDDWGVEGPVSSCTVRSPDTRKGLHRDLILEIYFGATEITAEVTDVESNSTASAKIDFITQ